MKQVLLGILLMFAPQFVQASLLSMDFMGGNTAQLFDSLGYLAPEHGAGDVAFFGGPGGANVNGQAYQLIVTDRIFIHDALIDFNIFNPYPDNINTTGFIGAEFNVVVYGQTIDHEYWGLIPDRNSQLLRSVSTVLYGFGDHLDVASESLNFWLNPGSYWIGVEGDGETTYFTNGRLRGNTEIPEPASLFLFGIGLPLLFRKRKK